MDSKIFGYVKNYVQEKYPIYANNIINTNNNFLPFLVGVISKECSSKEVCSGVADRMLDYKIEEYARINMGSLYNRFINLNNKVLASITRKCKIDSIKITTADIKSIARDVTVNLINNNDNNISEDLIISSFINKLEELSNKVFDYVSKKVSKQAYNKKINRSTYIYLSSEMVFDLLSKYSSEEIISGLYDDLILKQNKELFEMTRKKAVDEIKKIVNGMEQLFGVSDSVVVSHIDKEIFELGKLNVVDLFEGKLDDYIVKYAEKSKNINGVGSVRKYVFDLISKISYSSRYTDEELKFFRDLVLNKLREKEFGSQAILSGAFDEDISDMFAMETIAYNSIKNNKAPNEIEHITRKRKVPKHLLIIVLIAVLLSASNPVIKEIKYQNAAEFVDVYDDYDYDDDDVIGIHSIDNNEVLPIAVSTLNFYNNLKNVGIDDKNYCYLGFHDAYLSLKDDKLYIMDRILYYAQREAKDNPEYLEVYEGIKEDSCFLEFVVNRLRDMGCKKINDSKYMEVLEAYKSAMRDSDVDKPWDGLTDSQRIVIEYGIIGMYNDYCKDSTIKLSRVLPEIEKTEAIDDSVRRKK